MPNLVKYSTSNLSFSIREGNVVLGTELNDYGPTSSTSYWNGITPPASGFTIYTVPSNSNSPSIVLANNENELIYWATTLGGTNITDTSGALSYIAGLSNSVVADSNYPGINTNGLVLAMDASFSASYPRSNTTWYDISGNGNNSTLTNTPAFNNFSLTFDGIDDYSNFVAPSLGTTTTVEMLVRLKNNFADKMFFGWSTYDVWCKSYFDGPGIGYNTGNGDQYGITSTTVTSLGCLNNWKHYVFEMRSDVSYTNNKIYVNGVSQTLSQLFGTETTKSFNSGLGRISGWRASGGYEIPMDLAYFRVYNKSLSSVEILQNLYQGKIITDNLSHLYDASNLISYSLTGTSVVDMKSGVNGTLTNSPIYNTQYKGFWTFDGINDYLLLNNGNYSITLGNGDTNWTVNIWMKTTTSSNGLASNGDLLSNTNGGPIYSVFSVNAGKQTYWAYPSNINNWKQFQGTVTVNDGNWHMLTWVNNSNYNMDLYVDGVYDTTVSPTNVANNNPLDIIGGGLSFTPFLGSIASVQINKGTAFNRSQVIQQYAATKYRF